MVRLNLVFIKSLIKPLFFIRLRLKRLFRPLFSLYQRSSSIQKPKVSHKAVRPAFRRALISGLYFMLILLCAFSIFSYFYIFKGLPHPRELITNKPAVTTKILARDGRLLYKVYQGENRSIVSLTDIPPYMLHATIAIEDSEFYQHAGFSLKGITRAFKRNLTRQSVQGGSTITQQLVKTALLSPEKTLQRKVRELILSIGVESYFTKDEILTMYFNQIGYGGPNYGVEEAAQYYFAKSIKEVNLAEAALLAGLPAAPTAYSPFGVQPEAARKRQHEVLRRMYEEGYISQNAFNQALNTPLSYADSIQNIEAPHFVMYIKDLLAEKYGETAVVKGGMAVTTSLDLNIQELAETAVRDELANLKNLNVHNAAVLVTHPQTGEILAMVGSGNYFDLQNDGQVNVTLSLRQPGSSIKPLTYALALESGFTPSTIIEDSPVTYKQAGSEPYTPKNYDGRYHGRVTLRQALSNSYNIPAVKTLYSLGVNKLISKAKDLGITTWNQENRFGLSLTLGGGEVKMIDMAVLYGVFANQGKRVDLNPILQVTDFTGTKNDTFACNHSQETGLANLVQAATNESCEGKQVIKPEVAYLITDILSDNLARSSAFGAHSLLEIPEKKVSVKTGTTNNLRDNWTIGYTKDYLVAVWVGNNDNTPMNRVASGVTGATPIWNQIMTALLKDKPADNYSLPENLVQVTICPLTNTLSCAACPNPRTEIYPKNLVPKTTCNDSMIVPLLSPSPGNSPSTPLPTYSTTYVESNQLPRPSPTPPPFTSPFTGRSGRSKPPKPLR